VREVVCDSLLPSTSICQAPTPCPAVPGTGSSVPNEMDKSVLPKSLCLSQGSQMQTKTVLPLYCGTF
jgi:hypothetical protein